jgi:hypothetical protein
MRETRVTVAEINGSRDGRAGISISAGRRKAGNRHRGRAEILPRRPASCNVLVVDGFVNGEPAPACARSLSTKARSPRCANPVSWSPISQADDKNIERHSTASRKASAGTDALARGRKGQPHRVCSRGGPARVAWAELKARACAADRLSICRLQDLSRSASAQPATARFLTL